MVVSGSDRFAALGQFLAVGALAVAVFGVGRRIGLPGRRAAFGALLVPLLPVVLVQSWTGFTDLVFASFLVAAVYFGLGSRRGELVPFGLAVGLALGTKFSARCCFRSSPCPCSCTSPLAASPGFALSGLAGAAFGGIWYVANAFRADEALGDVDESGFQSLGLGPVAASLIRYVVEFLDLSGSLGADVLVYAVAGTALAVAALALRAERGTRRSLLAAAAAVALLPLGIATARRAVAALGETAWAAGGDSEVERWFAENAVQQTVSDGAVSWFGPLGVTMAVAALPLAVVAVKRGAKRTAIVMAAAPFLALLCVALSVVYLRYQGRYFVAGLALSASTWGLAAGWRAARVAIATAALVTAFLCLLNSIGKPSGLDLLHAKHQATVWSMPRWEQQGLLRWSPPERHEIRTMRFVERTVPLDASIGLALETNDFGFPYFGAGLTRRVSIVDDGDTIPPTVDWLVVSPGRRVARCDAAWRVAHRERLGWEVWRRIGGRPNASEPAARGELTERTPDRVAELAHAAVPARPFEDPPRERDDLGPRVRRDDRQAYRLEARRVVDVVADVGDALERDARGVRLVPDDAQLVVDAVDAARTQLLRAPGDHGVRLGRDDDVGHAHLVESPQADPVSAPAGDGLLAALVHPDAVVGEDAVEVEDDEPDLPEHVVGRLRHDAAAADPARGAVSAGATSSASSVSSSARSRRSVRPSSPSSS